MFNKIHFLIFLLIFFSYSLVYGQKNVPLENGSIFYLNDGSKLIGKVINDFDDTKHIEIITGDTVTLQSGLINKQYLFDEVSIYNNARFHYKKGFLINYSMGFSYIHYNTDFSLNMRFDNRFELGLGLGFHYNELDFITSSSSHWLTVNSIPFFAQGKYILNDGTKRFYLRGKLGYSYNKFASWDISNVKNGVMLDGALGLMVSSKKRFKYYLELSQYTSSISGTLENSEPTAISDIDFNVWFNKIVFTLGIEIGR